MTKRKSWSILGALLLPLLALTAVFGFVSPAHAVDYTVGGACGATIQECINFAAPGDTILIPAGTYNESLTLSEPISLTGASRATTIVRAITGQRVLTVTGAAIDNTVVISGLTLTEGDVSGGNACASIDTTNCGGGILLTSNAHPLLLNLTISENQAFYGGGLYADAGSDLTLQNVEFVENRSVNSGGGLMAVESSLFLADSLFAGNTGRVGGGLAVSSDNVVSQPVFITNTIFLSNTAVCPGALSICDGGAVSAFHIDMAVVNSRFENNACLDPFDDDCDGGAIRTFNSFVTTTLTLTNTNFISNAAGSFGGGVSANIRGLTRVQGGRFERNYAGGDLTAFSDGGGGLAIFRSLKLQDTQFISNTSGEDGGALWVQQAATIDNAQFSFNQAITDGGAIKAGFVDLILTDTTFISNTAGNNGGGAYAERQVMVDGGYFERNRANGPDLRGGFLLTDNGGGGIWAGSDLVLRDTDFISNTAATNGGGAYARGQAIINGGLFNGNEAAGDAIPSGYGGGGAYILAGLNFTGTTFANNQGQIGGGLFVYGPITATQGLFEANQSSSAAGGLYTAQSLRVTDTQFIGNSAVNNGGGALAEVVTATNTIFRNNAGASGGGLYTEDLTATEVQFIDNRATTFGGGGAYVFGPVELANARFEGNEALSGSGGGLQTSFDTVTLVNTNFISNTAGFNGGGLASSSRIESTDVLFQFNRTLTSAGGGVSTNGQLVLTNTQLLENNAGSDGGGAFANSGAILFGSNFEGNQSNGNGGGLAAPLGRLQLISGQNQFINNLAELDGGGAYVFDAVLEKGTFEENTSLGDAGGLRIRRRLYLTGTQFINNSAIGSGGGVVISATFGTSTNGRLVNALFTQNSAGSNGEALYLNLRSNVGLIHATIANPTPLSGAAIHVVTGTLNLTNSIVAGYSNDLLLEPPATANEDFNLYPDGLQTAGGGTVNSGGNSLVGNPAFADPAADDYHLTVTSAARDAGVDLGVPLDFEDDPRPQQNGPDIGWDEAPPFLPILEIEKTSSDADGGDLLPGNTLTYTLTISNIGQGPAESVVISDTLPANTTYVPGSISGGDSRNDSNLPRLNWLVNTLPLSTPIIMEFAVIVNNDVVSGTQLANTAAITSSQAPTPTFDTVTNTVREIFADARILKTVTPSTGLPGAPVTYTLIFSNSGQAAVTDVVITDIVPSSLTNINVISSGVVITDTGAAPAFVWRVQDLAPGQQGMITLTAEISSGLAATSITNTAFITTSAVDENPTNNNSTALLSVETIPPNLSISKTATPTVAVDQGGQITYTVTVSNTGGTEAAGVSLTDTLPTEVDFARWLQQNGATETGDQITWNGTVSANSAITVSFVVSHTGDYGDTVTNTAEFGYAGEGGASGSNTATFTVEPLPDPAPSGGPIYFPLIIKNNSGIDSPDLVVDSLVATTNVVTVVIKNIGVGPVVDAFWVDVYLNPDTPPTSVNQHWFDMGSQGIVWGITALPIAPTETLTLTIGDAYYQGPPTSNFSLPLTGTIYVQVDSVNLLTDYGGVLEEHEINGGAYNNITQTTVVADTSVFGSAATIEGEIETIPEILPQRR